MNKQEQYLDNLLIRGIVDIRKQVVVASAKKLPRGEFGLCLMCLNQNFLNIYDTNMKQDVGELLYSVDLTKITNFKASSFVFNTYLKFTYSNFKYKIVGFARAKDFISAVTSELS